MDEYLDTKLGADASAAQRRAVTKLWRIPLPRLRYLWRKAEAHHHDATAPLFVRSVVAPLGGLTERGKAYPEWRVLPRDHDIPRQNVTYVVGIRELSSTERN